jgi:O-antigen ligase
VKYIVFLTFLVAGVPAMTVAAIYSSSLRGWLVAALIFATFLGDMANINLMSMQQYRGPDRGFEITLADLICWSLILCMLIRFPSRIKWLPYNTLWMLVFFGLAAIATAKAPRPVLAYFSLYKMIRIYLVYWCLVNCLRAGVEMEYVWWGLVSIGMFMTLLALKQKYVDGLYRIHGPFDHSNTIPPYLNQIIPFLLTWGLVQRRFGLWQSAASVFGSLGMVFAVVATQSRAGMALAGTCLIATLVITNVQARSARVTAVTALVFVAIVAGGIKSVDSIIDRIRKAPKTSEAARDEFNVAAEMMAKENWFGVGLNNFSHVLTVTPKYRSHIKVMETEEQAGVAHHIYWLTAAELGYPGLIAFLIIVARFMWYMARQAYRLRKSEEGLILFSILLGAAALHLSGFLEWALRITPVTQMFAITTGFAVGLVESAIWVHPEPLPLPDQAGPALVETGIDQTGGTVQFSSIIL